ncbi:Retrovirus-related Pol polyprotein from transposon opus, partial [Mucuna pruriens]
MKYSVGNLVEVVWANQRIIKRCYDESTRVMRVRHRRHKMPNDARPQPGEDLKEVHIGLELHKKTKIGGSLDASAERELVQDMLGIDLDFLCHRLSIFLGVRLISQKKGRLGEEKKKAAKEETIGLLQARFIREVKCPNWLSNVVMNINALVDGAFGCGLISFMDAYSGYNQIRMNPCDEPKIVFITDNECRGHLSKANGSIFRNHIGIQLEVYVDDMVVKCKAEEKHFLGFMLTRRGTEENLVKCNAIIDMRSPISVKEVQQLVGRIMALAHFLSRLAKKATLIF